MPREKKLNDINYPRKEFLQDMARVTKADAKKNGEEVPDRKKFDTLMKKLSEYYGFGPLDFQNVMFTKKSGKGASYLFMPEYAEYLAMLLRTIEGHPLELDTEEGKRATSYSAYYNKIICDAEENLSKGFYSRFEVCPGVVNAREISIWIEPFLDSLAQLFTTITILNHASLGDVIADLTKYLDAYNVNLMGRYFKKYGPYEDAIKKYKSPLQRNLFTADVAAPVLNDEINELVEKELTYKNIGIDKILADLIYTGLYDYRRIEEDFGSEYEIMKLQEEVKWRAKESVSTEEVSEEEMVEEKTSEELDAEKSMNEFLENLYKENKDRISDIIKGKSAVRDLYQDRICNEYLSSRWRKKQPGVKPRPILTPTGKYKIEPKTGIPKPRYKLKMSEVSEFELQSLDRYRWKSMQEEIEMALESGNRQVFGAEESYLDFCRYIKEEECYKRYKEEFDKILGIYLESL